MKISKLFHWLYAILMFLPILVFIPNAFYYGFNEHSVAQEKTEQVPIYYETNDVTTISDLLVGNIYRWTDNFIPVSGVTYDTYVLNFSYVSFLPKDSTNMSMYITSNGNVWLRYTYNNTDFQNVNNIPFDFVLSEITNVNLVDTYLIPYITVCNTLVIKEYQPLVTNMSITDSMSYAWQSTWENDLFSWSYDSFLTQPFLYITNLFNVPATNTLLYCLSYWLNISIIWLCFDVVMYVPLLVHRWLDKGIIE